MPSPSHGDGHRPAGRLHRLLPHTAPAEGAVTFIQQVSFSWEVHGCVGRGLLVFSGPLTRWSSAFSVHVFLGPRNFFPHSSTEKKSLAFFLVCWFLRGTGIYVLSLPQELRADGVLPHALEWNFVVGTSLVSDVLPMGMRPVFIFPACLL